MRRGRPSQYNHVTMARVVTSSSGHTRGTMGATSALAAAQIQIRGRPSQCNLATLDRRDSSTGILKIQHPETQVRNGLIYPTGLPPCAI